MGINLDLPLHVRNVLTEFSRTYPHVIHTTGFRCGTLYLVSDKELTQLKTLASTYKFTLDILPKSVGIVPPATLMQAVQARKWYTCKEFYPGVQERDVWIKYIQDILRGRNDTCFSYGTLLTLLERLKHVPDSPDVIGHIVKYLY